ncbi:MAG: SGNH/GDSL hydrolase family protein [Balneola sp.]
MGKTSEEVKGILEQFTIPFFHLEKRFPLLPGKNDKGAEAALLGVSEDELKVFRENIYQNAKQAALELLKDDDVIDCMDSLPLDGTETIAVLGDSITEDGQGWFEILKQVLELSVEKADFTFINAGIGENTTSEALRRLDRDVLVHEPDWVFVALGTYDAQRLNIVPERTIVPLSETWENLESVQNILGEYVKNPVIWITPVPVITELLVENPLYEYSIFEEDLQQIRQLVAGKDGVIVDSLGSRMGKEGPEAWNYIADGLHHSLSGHMSTVKLVLKKLSESEVATD